MRCRLSPVTRLLACEARHKLSAACVVVAVLLLGGSAATLGVIGFLNTIPNLVFGLPAGALADRYDRRRLLRVER